jgi:hypothetical protein
MINSAASQSCFCSVNTTNLLENIIYVSIACKSRQCTSVNGTNADSAPLSVLTLLPFSSVVLLLRCFRVLAAPQPVWRVSIC